MKCPRNKIATVGTLSEGHQAKALKAFDEMRAEPAWMSRAAGWGMEEVRMVRKPARRRQCIVWRTEKLTTTEIIVSILICHHLSHSAVLCCSAKIMANIAKFSLYRTPVLSSLKALKRRHLFLISFKINRKSNWKHKSQEQ